MLALANVFICLESMDMLITCSKNLTCNFLKSLTFDTFYTLTFTH